MKIKRGEYFPAYSRCFDVNGIGGLQYIEIGLYLSVSYLLVQFILSPLLLLCSLEQSPETAHLTNLLPLTM